MQLLMPCMSASRPSPMVPWPPGSLGPSGLDLDGNDERGISPTLPHVSSDLTSGCACACRCVWPAAVTHKVLVPYLYPYLQYKTSQGGNCLDGVPRHPINRPRADCFDWFRRISIWIGNIISSTNQYQSRASPETISVAALHHCITISIFSAEMLFFYLTSSLLLPLP